jgi:hypothetical protein
MKAALSAKNAPLFYHPAALSRGVKKPLQRELERLFVSTRLSHIHA